MLLPEEVSTYDAGVVAGGLRDDELAWFLKRRTGMGSVEEHGILVRPQRWHKAGFPLPFDGSGDDRIKVTRGDVFAVADHCRIGGDWLPLLWTAYAWGSGTSARGPVRLSWVMRSDQVAARLAVALDELREHGAIVAYRSLSTDQRTPWLGPAFFTKVLYFAGRTLKATPGPLILDRILADRMRWFWDRRIGDGYAEDGRKPDYRWKTAGWSAYRYHVYLAFLATAVEQLSVSSPGWTPDLVEMALFRENIAETLAND